ncbi:MAG: hypothetical protein H6737_20630 [Alphaproteobacteria bacterium]|nr:hypothetical protein [Alphaproteobacteria bacterium]
MLFLVAIAVASDPLECVPAEILGPAELWMPPGGPSELWVRPTGCGEPTGCARFSFRVEPDGAVTGVQLEQHTATDAQTACWAKGLEARRFTAPGKRVELQLVFERTGQQGPLQIPVLPERVEEPLGDADAEAVAREIAPRLEACLLSSGGAVEQWPVEGLLAARIRPEGDFEKAVVESTNATGMGNHLLSCATTWWGVRMAKVSRTPQMVELRVRFDPDGVTVSDARMIAPDRMTGAPRDPDEVRQMQHGRVADRIRDCGELPPKLEMWGTLDTYGAMRIERTKPAVTEAQRACLSRTVHARVADRDWAVHWKVAFGETVEILAFDAEPL